MNQLFDPTQEFHQPIQICSIDSNAEFKKEYTFTDKYMENKYIFFKITAPQCEKAFSICTLRLIFTKCVLVMFTIYNLIACSYRIRCNICTHDLTDPSTSLTCGGQNIQNRQSRLALKEQGMESECYRFRLTQ